MTQDSPVISMRLARPADAEELYRLREDAAAWQVDRGEWWVSPSGRGRISAAVRVVDADPAIWGDTADSGFIHGLVVARDAIGEQLGSRVLTWAEEMIGDAGHHWARLDCVATNERLRSYYRAHGCVECGHAEVGPAARWHPVMRFEKLLSDAVEIRGSTDDDADRPVS
jgi:GNAT superfamily N-acetyltransferase